MERRGGKYKSQGCFREKPLERECRQKEGLIMSFRNGITVGVSVLVAGAFLGTACVPPVAPTSDVPGQCVGDNCAPVAGQPQPGTAVFVSAIRSRLIRDDAEQGRTTLTAQASGDFTFAWCLDVPADRNNPPETCDPNSPEAVRAAALLAFDVNSDAAAQGTLEISGIKSDPGADGTIVRVQVSAVDADGIDNELGTEDDNLVLGTDDRLLLVVRPGASLAATTTSANGNSTVPPGELLVVTSTLSGGIPFPGADSVPTCETAVACDLTGTGDTNRTIRPDNDGVPYFVTWEVEGLADLSGHGFVSACDLCVNDAGATVSTVVYRAPIGTGGVGLKVTGTDSTGIRVSTSFQATVSSAVPLSLADASADRVNVSPADSTRLRATGRGGQPPYDVSFALIGESPLGSLTGTGCTSLEAGAACESVTYSAPTNRAGGVLVQVELTDDVGANVSATISLTVASELNLDVTLASDFTNIRPSATAPITSSIIGGTPPYTVCYSVTTGSIGAGGSGCDSITIGNATFSNCKCGLGSVGTFGLVLVEDERVFTAPGAKATVPIKVAVRDALGAIASETLTMEVESAGNPGTPPPPVDNGPVAISVSVADPNICPGDTTTVTATASGGTGINTFTFTTLPVGDPLLAGESLAAAAGNATYTAPTAPTPNFARDIRVSVSETGGSSDNISVRISAAAPVADAGADRAVCTGDNVTLNGAGGNAFAWTGPPGAVFLPNENVQFPEVTPAVAGVFTVEVTDTNGCTDTDTATVTLQPQPVANLVGVCSAASDNPGTACIADSICPPAGVGSCETDRAICENGIANVAAQAQNQGTTLWSGGDGVFSNPNAAVSTYTAGLNDKTAGSVLITFTANGTGPCVGAAGSDSMTLTLNPLPTANAGLDQSICIGQTVQLSGSAQNSGSVQWETSGDGGFGCSVGSANAGDPCNSDGDCPGGSCDTIASSLNAVYTPGPQDTLDGAVTLTLVATGTATCAAQEASDSLVVTISDLPAPVITTPAEVCDGSSGNSASVPNVPGATFAWTIAGGVITSPADVSAITYRATAPPGPDAIELSVTVTGGNTCAGATSTFVDVSPNPTADAGPDQVICEDASAQLAGLAANASSVNWTGSGGSFNNAGLPDAVYTPGAADRALGRADLTFRANAIAPCVAPSTDAMTVFLDPLPTVDAGLDANICSSDTVILSGAVADAAAFEWLGGTGLFIPDRFTLSAEYAPSAGEIAAGSVTLTLSATPTGECTGSPATTDGVLITISNNPTATITHAGLCDAGGCTVCIGETNVSASIPSPGGPATIIWTVSGGNIVAGQGSTSILYNVTAAPGSAYTVSVGVDRDGCLSLGSIDVDVLADTCDDANECTIDTCSGGVCSNAPVANGTACIDDGIECTSDVCTAGVCTHPPRAAGASCGNQASQGVCDLGDTCNGAGTCLINRVPNGTECRASAGDCDVAESCDGASVNCPANGFVGAGTQCRASAGICDVAESCTGGSAQCPANDFEPDTVECRPSAGDCDAAEFCTGFTAACTTDKVESAGTPCGDQTVTDCDNPNTCNSTGVCLDRFVAAGTLCGNPIPQGLCDDSDRCDGAGACNQQFKADTFECRAAAGNCDQPEFCPGNGPNCPADVFTGGVCRPAAGPCDVPESCPGNSSNCPADDFESAGTLCRAGSGDACDPDEVCTGSSADCPADVVAGAGTVCNPGSGDLCDPDEVCSGVAGEPCPADTFEPNTTVCNPGSGDLCDPDEFCPGVADAGCPADSLEPNTTVCNPGSGDLCDPDELCSGVAGDPCPADVIEPNTTVCRVGLDLVCDPDELCTGAAGAACPTDFVEGLGVSCDDGDGGTCDDECDGAGVCVGGICP